MAKKAKKKDYICNSVHKNANEKDIRIACVRLWSSYIRNQEKRKDIIA